MHCRMNNQAQPEQWETAAAAFLSDVWRVFSSGHVFIGTKHGKSGKWEEHAFGLPISKRKLEQFFQTYPRRRYDLYFCPNAFRDPVRKKAGAEQTPFAWVDIDDAVPDAFVPPPGVLLETSRGRYQGLWRFRDWRQASSAEHYSKALAYKFGADRNGWSVTKYLRIPHTINHKPDRRKAVVKLIRNDLRITIRPPVVIETKDWDATDDRGLRVTIITPTRDWREVAEKYRRQLPPRARFLIWSDQAAAFERDKSKCIFEIIAGLHGAGAHPNEIAFVLFVNPYFRAKHGVNPHRAVDEVARVVAKLGGR